MNGLKKGKTKYDWVSLKYEFFSSNFLCAAGFIKYRLGLEAKHNGNVKRAIIGWARKKKIWKLQRLAKIRQELKLFLIEKARENIIVSLKNKRMIFDLAKKYMELMLRMSTEKISKRDFEFIKKGPLRPRDIWKMVEIEIRSSANITKTQDAYDNPPILENLLCQATKILKKC